MRRSNLSRSIDDASSNKLVPHSSRILFFLSSRSIDFFPTRLPSLIDSSQHPSKGGRGRDTPLLYIISFPYTRSTYTRETRMFIIFRWKKGGQKYTEYPRARRHPVDYFENIIAKRGEEKRGMEKKWKREASQCRGSPFFYLLGLLNPFLLYPAPLQPPSSLLFSLPPLFPPSRNGPFRFVPSTR